MQEAGETEPLKGSEGLVPGLYHHLWMKNQRGQSCEVNIPHTVVYQNHQPVAWYFTSHKEGKMMRKKRSNTQGPQMAEAFMAGRASQPEVCAWFSGRMAQAPPDSAAARKAPGGLLRATDGEEDSVGERQAQAQGAGQGFAAAPVTQDVAIGYLSYDRVQLLVDPGPYRLGSEQLISGVLQRFVEPRDPNDFMLRAIWSPSSAIFEKRTNKHRLVPVETTLPPSSATATPAAAAHQHPLTDRIASFASTSSAWLHEHTPVHSGALKTRLQGQCDAVAAHLRDVSGGSTVVARMELFFKIDTQNRIWLLYCSSLQLDRPARTIYNSGRIVPLMGAGGAQGPAGAGFVLKDPTRPEEVPVEEEEQGSFVCVLTGRTCPESSRVQVTYKQLVQHWFRKCGELPADNDRIAALDSIPPALRRANPNLTRDHYLRHRSQPSFLLNLASVCPEAEEEISAAAEDSGGVVRGRLGTPPKASTSRAGPAAASSSMPARRPRSEGEPTPGRARAGGRPPPPASPAAAVRAPHARAPTEAPSCSPPPTARDWWPGGSASGGRSASQQLPSALVPKVERPATSSSEPTASSSTFPPLLSSSSLGAPSPRASLPRSSATPFQQPPASRQRGFATPAAPTSRPSTTQSGSSVGAASVGGIGSNARHRPPALATGLDTAPTRSQQQQQQQQQQRRQRRSSAAEAAADAGATAAAAGRPGGAAARGGLGGSAGAGVGLLPRKLSDTGPLSRSAGGVEVSLRNGVSLPSDNGSVAGGGAARPAPPTPQRPAVALSGDELRTLKQLSEAYSHAELQTRVLLSEAYQLLQTPRHGADPDPDVGPSSGELPSIGSGVGGPKHRASSGARGSQANGQQQQQASGERVRRATDPTTSASPAPRLAAAYGAAAAGKPPAPSAHAAHAALGPKQAMLQPRECGSQGAGIAASAAANVHVAMSGGHRAASGAAVAAGCGSVALTLTEEEEDLSRLWRRRPTDPPLLLG